ncbi:hypothetical protein [Reichenbachiella ulvae]|uniref:Tetratricopeptide repeat-containing protein n=1 Tax=Reichenbachiella ulvae TaxID=2980104 RepID=A0ABT3CRY5_9BACT|nr:hypothetical protein [Reichenbachiella ulvae]MCV9386465.1 hypothetical protein [Reichenbachiella ulvae]
MNKQKFIELVGAAEKASAAEVKALEKLVQQYPYFQNGHVVLAKASQALKLPSTPKKMNTAAVYATNRAVFKNYITSIATGLYNPVVTKTTKPSPAPKAPSVPKGDMDKFIDEVYANLQSWKSSREQYLEYEKEHPEDIVILPVEDKTEEIEESPQVKEETPDYEKLKQQIADEVSQEEASSVADVEEDAIESKEAPTEAKAETPSEETTETKETAKAETEVEEKQPSAFDQVLDSIEAQIDSKVEETRKKKEELEKPAEPEDAAIAEEPAKETPKDAAEPEATEKEIEEETIPEETVVAETAQSKQDAEDAPDIEELGDQMAELEEQIAESAPEQAEEIETPEEEEPKEIEDDASEPEVEETSTDEDDESAPPVIDESVEEITPDTVYSFNSPPPVPQEAPADLSKKKTEEPKEETKDEKEEEMISSEELTEIVDKVSEKVESETGEIDEISEETTQQIEEELKDIEPSTPDSTAKPATKKEIGNLEDPSAEEIAESESIEYKVKGSDEDLDQYNEERKKLKLVPGASKGDKKFRLAILKRPHNFTKPKKEEGKKKDAEPASKKEVAKEVKEESADAPAVDKKTKTASSKKKKEETEEKTVAKKATKKSTTTKKTASAKKSTTKKAKKSEGEDPTEKDDKKEGSKAKQTKKKLSPKKKASDKKDTSDEEEAKKKTTELKRKRPDKEFQNSIIESFIATEPSIEVNKEKKSLPENTEDLSEKSTAFPDQLVTENLASILTEQGKISRAIEIYEKLILKNPQKKAYFASQIEKLNNL